MRTASVVKVPKVGWQGEDFTPNRMRFMRSQIWNELVVVAPVD